MQFLSWTVVAILSLGLLPSLTSLTAPLSEIAPDIIRYTGPINILKLMFPVLLVHLWLERSRMSPKLFILAIVSIALCGFGTLMAAIPCGFPAGLLREAFALSLGLIAGLNLLLLNRTQILAVVGSWSAFVLGGALLDWISRDAVDYLLSHFFDPSTIHEDVQYVGHPVLRGIFGRQSTSKLLVWIPWLLMFFSYFLVTSQRLSKKSFLWICGLLIALSCLLALKTSQRGPFVAMIAGGIALGVHQAWVTKNWKALSFTALGAIGILLLSPLVLPKSLWEARIGSMFRGYDSESAQSAQSPQSPQSYDASLAESNANFRVLMFKFSLRVIAEHPWGHACIQPKEYLENGISHLSHSHNLLLHQIRERGWSWGAFHALLWIMALLGPLIGTLKSGLRPALSHSLLFAGLVCVWVTGLVDHPWGVLNHSMVLGFYLWLGISQWPSFQLPKPNHL